MLLIVEGTPWFASPEAMRRMISQLNLLPERILRRMGFVMMISGLLLVFLGKR
jgi:uncharacterized protein YjeT (DUF2065 family)